MEQIRNIEMIRKRWSKVSENWDYLAPNLILGESILVEDDDLREEDIEAFISAREDVLFLLAALKGKQ